MLGQTAMRKALKLGLVDRGERTAQPEDNEASEIETQVASEGDSLMDECARPCRWGANEAQDQVGR